MKHFFFPSVAVMLLTASCSTQTATTETDTSDSTAVVEKKAEDKQAAFSLWNELSIRDTPGDQGKVLTTIYLGEMFNFLGDTATAASGKKNFVFKKVKLSDDQEGWVRADFIAVDAMPAAFNRDAPIHKRPDGATVTDKQFNALDYVAILSIKDGWAEVYGKRTGDTWFSTGFVRQEALTNNKSDLDFAALYRRAVETQDKAKSQQRLDQLAANSDLNQSAFYYKVFGGTSEDGEPDGTASGSIPENGLVALFDFGGNLNDKKGNEAALTNEGGRLTRDRFGEANAAFSCAGEGYLFHAPIVAQGDFTMAMWVKPSAESGNALLFYDGNGGISGYGLMFENGKLQVLVGGVDSNVTRSSASLPPGKWSHVALVREGSMFFLFVDGIMSSQGSSTPRQPEGERLVIGVNTDTQSLYYNGDIDDIYLYQRVLNSDEVKALAEN